MVFCWLPSSCYLKIRKERRKLNIRMLVQQNVLLFLAIGLIEVSLIASAELSTNNLNATRSTSDNVTAEPDYKEYAKVARYLVHKSGK